MLIFPTYRFQLLLYCISDFRPWFDTIEYLLDTIWGKLPDWLEVAAVCQAAARTNATLAKVRDGEITIVVNYQERSPLRMTLPAQGNVAPTALVRCLSLGKIMSVLAALLKERRVLFISQDLHRLTAGIWSMLGLLGPLQWQHVLIPVLPNVLINYCAAPMPFVLGILQDQVEVVQELPLEEVVFVYLDENKVVGVDVEDEILLPESISGLKNALSQAKVDAGSFPSISGATVAEQMHKDFRLSAILSEAVDQFWTTSWVGQYRRFIVHDASRKIIFDKTNFIKAAPKKFHAFLEALTVSQMWDHFILEREKLVESNAPFPQTPFELIVDRLMLLPMPEGGVKLDNLKSFFRGGLDKAAKLALEFVTDDPHDQYYPPSTTGKPKQASPSPSSQPVQRNLAPLIPAAARNSPKSGPTTPTKLSESGKSPVVKLSDAAIPRGQSLPNKLTVGNAGRAANGNDHLTAPHKSNHSRQLSDSASAAVTFDLISLHEELPPAPQSPRVIAPQPIPASPQSHDLIDFSFSIPANQPVTPPPVHTPSPVLTPMISPLASSNPFLDHSLFVSSPTVPSPHESPRSGQWSPAPVWNPFTQPQ